jgi:hypothetical protein
MTEQQMTELHRVCLEFITKQKITCPETIYQTDHVIENAYEFIEDVCDIVGYVKYEEDSDEN